MILAVSLLSGCGNDLEAEQEIVDSRYISFVKIGNFAGANIVYCKQTKVMYAISAGSYNNGTVTLLVNADGTPMLWEGD